MSPLVPELVLIRPLTLRMKPSKGTVIIKPSEFSLLMGDFGNFGLLISRPREAVISLQKFLERVEQLS